MARITDFESMYPLMETELPRCPKPLVLQHLLQGLRTFCMETEAWVVELAAIDVVADQSEYELDPVFAARIARVSKVELDGAELDPTRYDLLEDVDGETNPILKLDFDPASASTDGLVVSVVLVPHLYTDSDDLFPEMFVNRWTEGIIAEAMSELLQIPRRAWTNPERQLKYRLQRDEERAKAKRIRFTGLKRKGVRVNLRRAL